MSTRSLPPSVISTLPGSYYTGRGQEAIAVGAASAMHENDYVIGHHRSHGHLIAAGADLRRMMAEMFGRPDLKPVHEPERTGDVKHSLADLSAAKNVLDYKAVVDFRAGLAPTVAWYKSVLS